MRLIVLMLGALTLVSAPPLLAQDKKDLRGVIQELDAANGTITLIVAENQKARADRVRTFNLFKPDLPVTDASGNALRLTDLQPDDRVYLKMAEEDVVGIMRAPLTVSGTLSKVDGRVILVATKIGPKSYSIPEAAKIFDQNQPVQLQDLKTGAPLHVVLSPDQKTVAELRSARWLVPVIKLTKTIGYLIDFDRERHTLQVLINSLNGDHSLLRDLTFAKEPTFGLLYNSKPFREIAWDDLSRGLKVHCWLDTATRKVAHLEIEMPILGKRVVKALERDQRRLILDDDDGDKALALAPNVKVLAETGPGRLEDIGPNAVVGCGLSPDRKTVEVLRLWVK
jgi:hypothetical protein